MSIFVNIPFLFYICKHREEEKKNVNMEFDRSFLNVLMLSFGFMLVFTAFQTMGNIEVSLIFFIASFASSQLTIIDFFFFFSLTIILHFRTCSTRVTL